MEVLDRIELIEAYEALFGFLGNCPPPPIIETADQLAELQQRELGELILPRAKPTVDLSEPVRLELAEYLKRHPEFAETLMDRRMNAMVVPLALRFISAVERVGPEPACKILAARDARKAARTGAGATASPPGAPQADSLPDGPFDPNGFRYGGFEMSFGRAGKQQALVLALWDRKKRRPQPPRPVEDVITAVYGEDNDTEDVTFRQLCSDVQRRLDTGHLPLRVRTGVGKVWLEPRPV
jgi:hypothetical protein